LNNRLKRNIINALKNIRPYRIIVFGSYSSGEAAQGSDLDLYVVTPDDYMPRNFKEKLDIKCIVSRALDPLRNIFPIDLIVHTLPMYEKFKESDSSFSREVLENGMVVYEADHT